MFWQRNSTVRNRLRREPGLRPDRHRPLTQERLEPRLLLAAGGDTRHLRLAVTATEEYTAFFGSRTAAQAAIESTIAAVNKVFNRELNLQLDLIDNLAIIFGPGNSPDPFPTGGPGLTENQTLLDNVIGESGYDIGIVFGGLAVGLAVVASAGVDGIKAQGYTGISAQQGGPAGASAISSALHEMGHQLGAFHTFNGILDTCGGAGQRNSATAFEPGSGSTLVAYGGICGGDDLQANNDFYLHAASLDQIVAHLESLDAAGVGTMDVGVNHVPSIDAGMDYTIPARTPFQISVTASDMDDPTGDSLLYVIEQMDTGPAQSLSPFPGDNGSSPLFRSFPPAPGEQGSFTRVFPQLGDILSGTETKGEYLPTTTRELNFRATVRDGAGGTDGDDVRLMVVDTGSPFAITSHGSATTLTGGAAATVTWNVAGTTGSGINTSLVNILLSTDGGKTFPHQLARTANDGSHVVTVPNLDTSSARFKVQADGNLFFDISDADLAIASDLGAAGVAASGQVFVGEGGNFSSLTDTYTLALHTMPTSAVEITVAAGDGLEVSTGGASFGPTAVFTRADTLPQTVTVRAIDDSESDGSSQVPITHWITASSDPAYPTSLVIDQVVVGVADNEQPPLIGVDFQTIGRPKPENWAEIEPTLFAVEETFGNLLREDGMTTSISLTLDPEDVPSHIMADLNISSLTVPQHAPSLGDLGGAVHYVDFGASPFTVDAIWGGLQPGAEYNVYALAMEGFGRSGTTPVIINQTVTISGDGVNDPPPLVQNSTGKTRQLLVNDREGDDAMPLESFARRATADSSGQITVSFQRNDSVDMNRIIISGLAIQPVSDVTSPVDDFGDAPTAAQSGFAADYPTRLPDGARHTHAALRLGLAVDTENDGQPTAQADGDGSDEDGVRFVTTAVATSTSETVASLLVTASAAGKLDAWIDFNRDGDWLDAGESLFATSLDLVAGANLVGYTIPAGASAGPTYARFRLSTAGGLGPTGPAADGEVEDYRITILDGDSPVAQSIDLVVGAIEIVADGSDLVVRQGGVALLRAPGSTAASLAALGTGDDDSVELGDLSAALPNPIPLIYDGAAGRDWLTLVDAGQSLDLTNAAMQVFTSLEEIRVVGAGPNALILDGSSVGRVTDSADTLVVVHDEDDVVDYVGDGWEVQSPIFVAANQRHVLTNGTARVETINTRPFQNPFEPTDVNFSGATSSLDALQVINFLGRSESISVPLPTPTSPGELPERYYDVNGSETATALDALNVINFLGRQTAGGEELEVAVVEQILSRNAYRTEAVVPRGDHALPVSIALDILDQLLAEWDPDFPIRSRPLDIPPLTSFPRARPLPAYPRGPRVRVEPELRMLADEAARIFDRLTDADHSWRLPL